MSDQMSETEDATQFLTWNEFLAALGMPPALRELSERQMRYGICSEPDCQWPIAGWCVACRAKLCLDHLAEHRNLHARERLRASERDENARDENARDELLAHLVDDGTISAEVAAIDELVLLATTPLYHDQEQAIASALCRGRLSAKAALRERQRLFGICSVGDCDQPIAGYVGYGPKLCMLHLIDYVLAGQQPAEQQEA